ncbi:MAG: hypothetical protein QME65_00925 [Candidatus Omnitrophota bacterium]|nr:hypothetical protein [Candidatus Omnitrophota bacterium]
MKKKLALTVLMAFTLFFIPLAFAFDLGAKNFFDNPLAANLVYPAKEEADLAGRDTLEFRWSDDCPIETEGYEFRLYKGYASNDANLISKENLSAHTNSFKISADKFEGGSIYTWSIRRIANGGRKSDLARNAFRVKK